jgi:Glycosyltransferase
VLSALKFQGKTASICRMADRVIVGNRLLAGYAAKEGAKRVDVIPSTIDLQSYPPRIAGPRDSIVTLGWTGSHSTLQFLESMVGTLKKLAARRNFRLVVVSHTSSYRLPDLPVETIARKWSAQTEASDLADVDIGLAPFPNTGWTPWRCHGKVLQYMAAGIPTVASNIGILPDYIEDGANGYLAQTQDEWIAKLEQLMDAPGLRAQFAARSRRKIEECYSAQVWAPRVADILQSTVGAAA